jgi:hypothetical protein
MANQEKAIPGLPVANNFANAATDSVVAVVGGNTVLVSAKAVQSVNATMGTPANSSAMVITVPPYPFWTDGNFLYVATANNTVKRAALSSF